MTIKFSRPRSLVGAVSTSSSKHTRGSIGTGLIGLTLVLGGVAGCPGQLPESVGFPPGVAAGSGGRGGIRSMAGSIGSSPRRVDAAVAAANCWEPAEITNRILVPKCGNANCHDNVMPSGMLDSISPGARMRLQNVPSRLCGASAAGARPLVAVQGNNVSGHLFDKLAGNQPANCGQRMPRNGMMAGYLNATEIQCLKDWFTRNAVARPPDAAPPPTAAASALCPNPATDAVTKVLQPKCGLCHNPATPAAYAANLDLFNPGAKARMEGIGAKTCVGRTLIIRGRPEGFFFDKVQGQTPGCGDRMPPIGPGLSAEEIKCLKDWIAPGIAQ